MKTLNIFTNSLKRSRMLIILAVVFGILLCVLYNFVGSMFENAQGGVPVGIKDEDKTTVTKDFMEYLSDDLEMQLTVSDDQDELDSDLVEKHIAAVITIPEGFEVSLLSGDIIPLEISYMDDYENAAFINSYIDNYVKSAQTIALASDKDTLTFEKKLSEMDEIKMPVETEALDANIQNRIVEEQGLSLVFGFYLMVAFVLALGFANLIFSDRNNGTFNRVKVTSVRTSQYLLGMCMNSIVCSLLLVAGFLIYAKVKGTYMDIDVYPLLILSLAYSVMVVAMALMFAMWLNSNNSIMAAIVGMGTVCCILGGAFFPLDYSPEFLQQLAKITPQYWFMEALYGIIDADSGWWFNAGIVAMFGLLFFVLAGVRFAGSRIRPV